MHAVGSNEYRSYVRYIDHEKQKHTQVLKLSMPTYPNNTLQPITGNLPLTAKQPHFVLFKRRQTASKQAASVGHV